MEALKGSSQVHEQSRKGNFPEQMGGTDQMSPKRRGWAGAAQQGRTSGTSAAEGVPGTTLGKSKSNSTTHTGIQKPHNQTPPVTTRLLVQAVLWLGQLPCQRQCAATKQHQQVLLLLSRGAIPAHPYLVFLFFVTLLPWVASAGDKLKPLCSEKRKKSSHKNYIPSNRLSSPARVTDLQRVLSVWNWWCKHSDPEETSDTQHPHWSGSWEQFPSPYTQRLPIAQKLKIHLL